MFYVTPSNQRLVILNPSKNHPTKGIPFLCHKSRMSDSCRSAFLLGKRSDLAHCSVRFVFPMAHNPSNSFSKKLESL